MMASFQSTVLFHIWLQCNPQLIELIVHTIISIPHSSIKLFFWFHTYHILLLNLNLTLTIQHDLSQSLTLLLSFNFTLPISHSLCQFYIHISFPFYFVIPHSPYLPFKISPYLILHSTYCIQGNIRPSVYFPSLSTGNLKTGQIKMSQTISLKFKHIYVRWNSRWGEIVRVEGQKLHEAKITLYTVY